MDLAEENRGPGGGGGGERGARVRGGGAGKGEGYLEQRLGSAPLYHGEPPRWPSG